MLRKKRRMEFARPGERRRREERERASQPITRRTFVLRGMMGVGFAALTGKLWRMQIAEGVEFKEIAEDNIVRFEPLDAPRGRITDRSGRVLAENRRSWSVKIVGSRLPEDEAERQRVLDTVAVALQLKQVLVLDRARVPIGSETAVASALAQRLETDSATLVAWLARPDAHLHLLQDELSSEEAATFEQNLADIPGVRILNGLDYTLETHVSPDVPILVKKDVDRETALQIAANVMYLPGVVVDDNTLVREYSGGPPFSHILGYVGPITEEEYEAEKTTYDQHDGIGRGGIEQALERELRGAKGGRWVLVDAAGVEQMELLDRRLEPQGGLSARLTIDRAFQLRVTQALQNGIDFANADALKKGRERVGAGVAIVINPQNGEILAMASLPTFNNQDFVDGISEKAYTAYVENEFEPLLNRAISGVYPPGSTLKPLLAAAGLQEDVIKTDTRFRCLGNIRVPWTWDETQGNVYPCWLWDVGHGDVDVYAGIAQSCDVFFYNVGAPDQKSDETGTRVHYYIPNDPQPHYFQGLGIERIKKYLTEVFGFGAATGIELAGEAEGLVPDQKWLFQNLEEYWSIGDTINVSIGQGHLLCTPLQLLLGTAAIANGGILYRPRLIKELVREDGTVVTRFEPKIAKDLRKAPSSGLWLNPGHLTVVREGMRRTVTEGTALGRISVGDVVVGAKSGTAEFGEAEDGKYTRGHAWFSAFAPFDKPEICVVVLVVAGHEGSVYAGPIANEILNTYFHEPGVREAAQAGA